MTFEEALKKAEEQYEQQLEQAKKLCNKNTLGIQNKAFISHAIEWALEKQKPKFVVQTYTEQDMRMFDCPRCKDTWTYQDTPEVFRYCPSCGQKIDFEGHIELEEGE
jgi:peptide subunit release factor 1 (eRF1)